MTEAKNVRKILIEPLAKRSIGRPSIQITPELLKKAEDLGKLGLTMRQIACALGMGKTTLYEKLVEYPSFSDAVSTGKAKGMAIVTAKLLDLCKLSNVEAIKFYLSRVGGMTEQASLRLSNADGSPLQAPTSYIINFVDGPGYEKAVNTLTHLEEQK